MQNRSKYRKNRISNKTLSFSWVRRTFHKLSTAIIHIPKEKHYG